MISINKIGGQTQTQSAEIYGLSTDIKPIDNNIPNGSIFYEMDTSKLYLFDKQNKVWILQ